MKFTSLDVIFNDKTSFDVKSVKAPWRCQKTLCAKMKLAFLNALLPALDQLFLGSIVEVKELKLLNRDPGQGTLRQQLRHCDLSPTLELTSAPEHVLLSPMMFTITITLEEEDKLCVWSRTPTRSYFNLTPKDDTLPLEIVKVPLSKRPKLPQPRRSCHTCVLDIDGNLTSEELQEMSYIHSKKGDLTILMSDLVHAGSLATPLATLFLYLPHLTLSRYTLANLLPAHHPNPTVAAPLQEVKLRRVMAGKSSCMLSWQSMCKPRRSQHTVRLI